MIDPEGLDAFVAIAADRSFSRAAQRLGIAQSVISKRLRRLEDRLGAALIDRSNRNDIALTRLGELYLAEARQALNHLRQVERIGMDLARGRAGPVRIGYIFSATMNGTLPALLRHLSAVLPDIELQPRLMETPQQLTALENGDLDIVLIRARPSYPANCKARLIVKERLMLFHPASHRFADQSEISCDQFAGERFIIPQFRERVGLIYRLEELSRAGNFTLERVIHTEDYVTAAAMVASGQGIALAPISLTALQIDGLVAKPISGYREMLDLVMVYPANLPIELLEAIESMEPRVPEPRDW